MGGTNVAANTQAGRTNTQTIGTTSNTDQRIEVEVAEKVTQANDTNKVKADSVETIVVNEVPAWVILLLILGWLFPSPNEIGRWVRSLFSPRRL
jgi:Fe2+ transport system protein B